MSKPELAAPLRLDLGSGARPREGFQGVDIAAIAGVFPCDLTSGQRWPWGSETVDELNSSHFIEHIGADYVEVMRRTESGNVLRVQQDRLLFFFDEAYRIIKPGGLFHLAWPALQSTDAFRDPTHRRFIPLEMLYYLSRESRHQMGLDHYEANCDWVVKPDSTFLQQTPEKLEPPLRYDLVWNVQKAWSVTLVAQK